MFSHYSNGGPENLISLCEIDHLVSTRFNISTFQRRDVNPTENITTTKLVLFIFGFLNKKYFFSSSIVRPEIFCI